MKESPISDENWKYEYITTHSQNIQEFRERPWKAWICQKNYEKNANMKESAISEKNLKYE